MQTVRQPANIVRATRYRSSQPKPTIGASSTLFRIKLALFIMDGYINIHTLYKIQRKRLPSGTASRQIARMKHRRSQTLEGTIYLPDTKWWLDSIWVPNILAAEKGIFLSNGSIDDQTTDCTCRVDIWTSHSPFQICLTAKHNPRSIP